MDGKTRDIEDCVDAMCHGMAQRCVGVVQKAMHDEAIPRLHASRWSWPSFRLNLSARLSAAGFPTSFHEQNFTYTRTLQSEGRGLMLRKRWRQLNIAVRDAMSNGWVSVSGTDNVPAAGGSSSSATTVVGAGGGGEGSSSHEDVVGAGGGGSSSSEPGVGSGSSNSEDGSAVEGGGRSSDDAEVAAGEGDGRTNPGPSPPAPSNPYDAPKRSGPASARSVGICGSFVVR